MSGFVTNAAGQYVIIKNPNATLDYTVDWTAWLDDLGDSITSATAAAETGLICQSFSVIGKTVVIWLAGGTSNRTYKVTCTITTPHGRIESRYFYVNIR